MEGHSAPYKGTHLEARLQLQTLARNVSWNVIQRYQRFGNTPVTIIPSSALNWSWRSHDGATPVKRSCFGARKHVGYVVRLYGSLKICGPKRKRVTGSGEYYMTMSFMFCTHGQILFGDHIIENEMGWACGQVYAGCWWGGGCERERERSLGRPRRRWKDNIIMNLEEMGQGGMDWIDLAQDRDKCSVFVMAVMSFWIP